MRSRNVYPLRQALASDINDQNLYRRADQQNIIRDVIGATKGVAKGLSAVHTGLTLTVSVGSVCDSENIYELLEQTDVLLPSTPATYKIYAQYASKNDLPVAGFRLTDVVTRNEVYDIVNTRTYDGINIGFTTGSIPLNSELLGEAVVDGIEISSYTDMRNFLTVGNLENFDLQYFVDNNKATIVSQDYYSAVFGGTNNPINITLSNLNFSTGIIMDLGTDPSSTGIRVSGENNYPFISNLRNSGISYLAQGLSAVSTVGFKSESNTFNFIANNSINQIGYTVNGSNNNDVGFVSTNSNQAILITNTNVNTSLNNQPSQIKVNVTSPYSLGINDLKLNNSTLYSDQTFSYSHGSIININQTGVGYVARWNVRASNDDGFIGYVAYNNTASTVGGTGFLSQGLNNGFISRNNAFYGFTNVRELSQNSGFINLSTVEQTDALAPSYLNVGYTTNVNGYETGNYIYAEVDQKGIGQVIGGSTLDGLTVNKLLYGTRYLNAVSAIEIGEIGSVGGISNGILINNAQSFALDLKFVDQLNNAFGLSIINYNKAIDILNSQKPITINNNSLQGTFDEAINLVLGNKGAGITISNHENYGIKFNGINSPNANFITDIKLSNEINVGGITVENPASATVSTALLNPNLAVLQVTTNAGTHRLNFYDGNTWRVVNVT